MVEGKKILLCVTGSIAAYKSVVLLRLLIKSGAEVKVIMTAAATDFVSPLTFSTLSKNEVLIDLVKNDVWTNHIDLGRWADVMVIAPASANTIAKMANGICDNLLLAVYLSSICKVIIAPAMDEDMWHHEVTQKNIRILKQNGNEIINVNDGELASGLVGEGRMAEPEEIEAYLDHHFSSKLHLKGKKGLVTAGPTYEAIDPVRFIGNHSSGKMGVFIAEELSKSGAEVTLVLGPSPIAVNTSIETIRVTSAHEMYEACMRNISTYDIIVMAAAVADYTPKSFSNEKIKKESDEFSLNFKKTNDILSEIGKIKTDAQTLVGFALETENEKTNALKKLKQKNADFIVLNSLKDAQSGFGYGTNKITIFERNGIEHSFPLKSKRDVATDIVKIITKNEDE